MAHSLGGLVVANALSRSYGTEDAPKEIADHTIGTLFLGTPFEGSNKANYASLAVSFLSYFMPTQTKSLEDLVERSDKLASICDLFAKFLKDRDRSQTKPYLEVACFFEACNLYQGKIKIGIIVPKESASWLGVDALSISKDHVEMCKFEDEDGPAYKNVVGKLRQWIENIGESRETDQGGVGGVDAQVCCSASNL